MVMAGKHDVTCERTNRLVLFIGQYICRSVTDGEWKLLRNILLCATIRHLYRSKQLTNIIFRLGHCESYDFGLEFETAQVKAIDEVSNLLTPQIVTGEGNHLFHSEWDNLKKIMTNVRGSNVVNSAGGITIQETNPVCDVTQHERSLPTYYRTKGLSWQNCSLLVLFYRTCPTAFPVSLLCHDQQILSVLQVYMGNGRSLLCLWWTKLCKVRAHQCEKHNSFLRVSWQINVLITVIFTDTMKVILFSRSLL